MYPYLIAGVVGALIANRRVPKTKCSKSVAYGPSSGTVYKVEDFAEAGFLVVHDPDGSVVTLKRTNGLLKAVSTSPLSSPSSVLKIRKDFEGSKP